MLNAKQHEIVLKKILRDIYSDPTLSSSLGFKGGTALYLFYELDRFSTDLDFNITNQDFDPEVLGEIVKKHINVVDERDKRYTYFLLGSFEKGAQKIKVEVNKREYPDEYEIKDFYGLSVRVMKKSFMFAHKLVAITDRKQIYNRDLYDSWFMFSNGFEPEEKIIQYRTDMSKKDYYKKLVTYIKENVNENNLLKGLGEVLTQSRKGWVKNKLVDELIFELEIRN